MKKKIFIGIGIFTFLLIVGFLYLNYRNRSLSPPGVAKYEQNNLSMEISYSRPSVKGRQIFGTKEEGALLPYGVYWRLGANEATEITISRDVLFNGNELDAGTYKMYAVPGPETFEISLNSELGNWGYSEPDYDKDILKTTVPVETGASPVEQFTIRFEESGPKVLVVCEWSDVKVKIPVDVR